MHSPGMNPLELFGAYAAAFEETFADDDWSRLDRYFSEDAVYEVAGSAAMACRIQGRAAILAGLKKSLDGFDRQLDGRRIELTSEPEVTEDSVTLTWNVTYSKDGAPEYVLTGRSCARYADGVIVELVDSYAPEVDKIARDWATQWAPGLNPSYV